ncbi:MAG: aminotransferase class I/II-fold pyridoxal phosphate-dependent enzyme [Flavobacteriales bacterium]|nr:aminotransferase class I/II-fold pyridoxal phosphate-dependent enzyme [Flavobacteriales bacterium]
MYIDLRSDTVTQPTQGMLNAMLNAKVGDDVFGEDETVVTLEQKCANLFGKEAGLFCPSGTMSNQIAIKILSHSPGEMICERFAHVYNYEGGGASFNSGISAKLIKGNRGRISAQQLLENINPDDVHFPKTQLLCIENTCNKGGGSYYHLEEIKEMARVCHEYGLHMHLDGARIFNALTETEESPSEWGNCFDTLSVCLSKGLGAPVGSVLLSNKEFIKKARRIRKVLGGGMRQAGHLAAAGIYALENNVIRLKEDHRLAKQLGNALEQTKWVEKVWPVETNIVVYSLKKEIHLQKHLQLLASKNIKAIAFGPQEVRMVTHLNVNEEMIRNVCKIISDLPY